MQEPVAEELLEAGVEIAVAVDILLHGRFVEHGGGDVQILIGDGLIADAAHQPLPLPILERIADGVHGQIEDMRGALEGHVLAGVIALHEAVQIHAHIIARRARQILLNEQVFNRRHAQHEIVFRKAAKGHRHTSVRKNDELILLYHIARRCANERAG